MICKLANINDITANKWYEFSLQTVNGLTSIMLRKQDNGYIAYKNLCPHQGRRMDYATNQFLISESGTIICPAHGAEFEASTGLCINGPCLGQSLQPVHIQQNEENIFTIIK